MEAKKTPLYEAHKELGAKIVEFAGYLMPVWYEGIKEEVAAVRNAAGLFDTSHMGRIVIGGSQAEEFLQKVATNDIQKLKPGRALYTLLCRQTGGVIDDIIIYQSFHPQIFNLVVNASNFQKDLDWLKSHGSEMEIRISDITKNRSMLALQGPQACEILKIAGLEEDILAMKYFSHDFGCIFNIPIRISRTGYTGEDGFEIFVNSSKAEKLWKKILEAGKEFGLKPCGLGARDILRLEAGLPLYGHELSEEITPLEAGLEKYVSYAKEEFIGKDSLIRQKAEGLKRKLVGFEVISGRIARPGYPIFSGEQEVGRVASGVDAYTLGKSIGTGFVKIELAIAGTLLEVDIRGQKHQAKIVELPFYKRPVSH